MPVCPSVMRAVTALLFAGIGVPVTGYTYSALSKSRKIDLKEILFRLSGIVQISTALIVSEIYFEGQN